MKTQKVLSHNNEEELNDNIELDYVSEECFLCHKHMIDVEYIYTDLDSGNYCCEECISECKLNAVPCEEIN